MRPFLFCSILFGTRLFSNPDCCPPQTTSPCECMQNPNYSELKSARPCIGSCQPSSYTAALEMSFLVWEGREEGLQFAMKNNPILTPASNVTANVNGKMRGINFAWQPAFKLNFEQDFSNSWDFDMRWTCFYSRSTASHHATIDATTSSGLFPLWVLPQSYETLPSPHVFGKARGIWNLHLNTLDLELGYAPFLTPKLSLRLHLGVKGISIFQRLSILYSEGINDGTNTLLPSKTALRNQCLGAGPRFGFNSQWGLNKGWSILADGAASFTLSEFTVKRKDFDETILSGTLYSAESKFRERFHAFRPNLEGLLGVGWDTCYGKRKQYSFDFKAAYEVQFYSEQNMMRQLAAQPISFSAFSMRGDLHCHGLTTMFRFGF